ncbi:hypothetical protein B0H10DRAFT_2065799 [Mycena sp. CBHHK59/15]|nr:hypothetical protein B0H10DRAFT_2065799 [Mycena sp. CBHHK59/15]
MQYYYARRTTAFASPTSSPLESPVYGIVAPAEQVDMKVQLRNRLNSGRLSNMPAGFPFRHTVDGRGTPGISYDAYEFREELQSAARCTGHLAANVSFSKGGAARCKKTYLSWTAHLPQLDLQPYSPGPPVKVPVAQVRVDNEVMNSTYGRYIEKDPRIILRALSISLELGLLVTITFEECDDLTSRYRNVIYIGTANNGRRSVIYTAGSYRV